MILTKSRRELKKVLMSPRAKGVPEPYYLIRTDDQVIYVISPGQNGAEFNKTVGFVNDYPGISSLRCLYGQGVVIMQRNDEFGEAKEFKVVTVTYGRQVEIPSAWAVCLVNIGKNFLVVLTSGVTDPKYENSKPIIEKQGLAYYVVEKKGEIGFEQNPHYSVYPQINTD